MLPLIVCYIIVVLSIVISIFTVIDRTKYNLPLNILKYSGMSINLILSILSLIFVYNTQTIVYCIICISILFLFSAGLAALKFIFLRITTDNKFKIYKYICAACSILQLISVIVFCSQF